MEDTVQGRQIYQLAEKLFPICRSLTGEGNRKTLQILSEVHPVESFEIPSGTQAFDWVVPDEWYIHDAYIEDERGNRYAEFSKSNLHVVGYSEPVDKIVKLEELKRHIYTLPAQPDWVPYVTSYYKRRYGFCMTQNQMDTLKPGKYRMYIDSNLTPGSLTYGQIVLPGKLKDEVFLSTYICHPSMANNEISGPCIAIYLAKWLASLRERKYTYRIVFVPETLGSLVYLSQHLKEMKENIRAGFVLTCVGDARAYSYLPSRKGNTLADKVAKNVLKYAHPEYREYSFLDRGSDERQYCAPGVDLPVCSVMRTKYGVYPEYHTSADNMDLISADGLMGALDIYQKCLRALECNEVYTSTCLGEPQLGKRGLYPTESYKGSAEMRVRDRLNFLAYADGENDLIDISNAIGISTEDVADIAAVFLEKDLVMRDCP